MKYITTLALFAIVTCSALVMAGDFETTSLGQKFADRNCTWCHGPSLQGYTTAPRLAGQKAAYIANQLLSFKTHARDNPLSQQVMWGAAVTVTPEIAHELGSYISMLDAEAANDGRRDLEDKGRAIYQVGDAASNIPSCVVCHGPEAQGTGAIPRLGGLSNRYLERRLEQWGEGYHASAVFPMPAVAGKLSADDVKAIASYLSFVR